jgi:hypothetical protein
MKKTAVPEKTAVFLSDRPNQAASRLSGSVFEFSATGAETP